MRQIPTAHGNYINYNGEVFLLEENSKGNVAYWQIEGVLCRQAAIKGFVFAAFKTSSKWFDGNWWYQKTSWSQDPEKIYFKDDSIPVDYAKFADGYWNKIYEKATHKARPIENILKAMLEEVNHKTKHKVELDFTDLTYGLFWHEAYIPVKIKDKKYILTWENCD